jgi:hypothetical protein
MLDVHDPHESIHTWKSFFTARTVQRDWEKARLILADALR